MKWPNHILLVAALLVVSVPHHHDEEHGRHVHENAMGQQMCALPQHDCGCHACEEIPCAVDLKTSLRQILSGGNLALPPPTIPLYVFREAKPCFRQPAMPRSGALSSLQTIRLLI